MVVEYGPGIERQDNAKRVMLIGSMLLHMLDLLDRRDDWRLPNLPLFLSLFLQFAEEFKDTCELNEDGWKYLVINKADRYLIKIEGLPGTNALIDRLRDEMKDQESEPRVEISPNARGPLHWEECYQNQELSGARVLTLEELNQGTRRCWERYHFFIEVCNKTSLPPKPICPRSFDDLAANVGF